MSDNETEEQAPRFITIAIHRKDGPPIVYQEPDDDRALYWEPFANLREWLRDECVRLNAHPLLASLHPAPRFSWVWDTTEFSITYQGKAGTYTVELLYSHEHRAFCYGIGDDPPLEQHVTLKDGFGVFVSPDGQVLTLEEVGQRVLSLLFNTAKENRASTGTLPVC